MLSHFAVEFGAPPIESASRAIPTIGIRMRNGLQNATYSDKRFPKIVIKFSCIGLRLFLSEFCFQFASLFDCIARTEIFQLEQLTNLDVTFRAFTVRIGRLFGPFNRLLFGFHLDEPVAGNQLLRFRKWTVEYRALPPGKPDAGAL